LVEGWTNGDAIVVNKSLVNIAAILPSMNSGAYPDASRLRWESWYFSNGNLVWIWLVYAVSVVLLLIGLVYHWRGARVAGIAVFIVAFMLHSCALGLRWWISSRWPNSNMFEAVTTSAWFGGCAAVILEIFLRRRAAAGMFALASGFASAVALMAAHFLPIQLNAQISNMMPVLHDVWLYIHTNVIIFSYCLIFMAAVSAGIYLVYRVFGGKAVYARVGSSSVGAIVGGGVGGTPGAIALRGEKLGEVLDGVTMLLMKLSFVLLWTGIAMGAIWADHSWGRPWGWDPKEVFALNTFVVFAILVHVRYRSKDKGLWTAILAVVGAAVMLFNWIVINFIITGLHSYA
jgi:cytochrome c-type biogenesis protein CcsB